MSSSSSLPETRQVVRVHQFGGPEVLKFETVPMPTMSPTQILVRTEYAGVNYIDTYHRGGLYPNPLPLELGRESSGTILAIGAEVDPALKLAVGDRVVLMAQGGYCTYAAVDPASMVRVPDGVDLRDATAAYLQGLTAHYLGTRSHAIQKGDVVLIHAAAGGTGALLVQIAKLRGATVIGTVGSEAKAELAKKAGADHVINYQTQDFLEEVRKLYPQGVHAVYDGVGKATYERSMKCLQRLGSLVLFGNASGPVPPINPLELSKHGSIFLSRPTLVDFVATRDALETRAADVFGWIREGKLKVTVAKELPLAEAAEAHKLLEGRSLAGKILLKCA